MIIIIEEALRTLYDIDEMTQADFDPAEALARLNEPPRLLSQMDEDFVIQLFESGIFPDDMHLRDEYYAIMERRAEESTDDSEQSSISAGSSTEEEIITYAEDANTDEEEEDNAIIHLARPPTPRHANLSTNNSRDSGDIIYDEFAHQTHDDSNISDAELQQFCDLIYQIDLRAGYHSEDDNQRTVESEHFEDNDYPQVIFCRPPWTELTDEEKTEELQHELMRTRIIPPPSEDTQIDSSQCFTQNEILSLGDNTNSDDVIDESTNSTKVEKAEAATVNKIYGGPADSLAHGWLIDSGASCHMTPFKSDLSNIQQCRANVTVADGSKIRANTLGEVTILLPTNEDNYNPARVLLRRVLYVPGLNRRLFSVHTFTQMPGYEMTFYENRVHVTLPDGKTADVPNHNDNPGSSRFAHPAVSFSETHMPTNNWPQQQGRRNSLRLLNTNELTTGPKRGTLLSEQANTTDTDGTENTKQTPTVHTHNKDLPKSAAVDLDLLHDRLGHRKTTAIITASHHRVWDDTYCVATKDHFCTSCPIATISRARTPRNYSGVPDTHLRPVIQINFSCICCWSNQYSNLMIGA